MTTFCNRPPEDIQRLDELVAWHAGQSVDLEAAVLGHKRWTYRELSTKVDALAAALLHAGVAPGDRVATLQTPHPDFVVAFLATVSIGAIWVGLNPRYRIEEIRHVVEDSRPTLLLARTQIGPRSYAAEIAELAKDRLVVAFDGDPAVPGVCPMDQFLARRSPPEELTRARAAVDPEAGCLIVYTSGSTGRPKGALLRQRALARFAMAQNDLWPVTEYRAVNYFPINHIGSVIDCLLPCLAAGGTMYFMEDFDPAGCLALMEREQVTIWASVPSVFAMQLALPDFDRYDLSSVELIIWEGAAMPVDLIGRLREICSRLATNYGMTESGSAITALPPTDDLAYLANTVGPAFPSVSVRLRSATDEDCPSGEVGEVQVKSPFAMIGYWNNPDATAAAFTQDGFLRTGDLAKQEANGFYRIVGRLKEMFKSGGYNVYPREIECVLESHPEVELAAVVAASDPVWQEIGVAFVAVPTGFDIKDLIRWCQSRLANYKVPKHFVARERLPLLPIGKIDKPGLAREAEALFGGG